MPILFYYICQVIAKQKCDTFVSKMWRKTIRQCCYGWSSLIFSKTFSILRNTFLGHSKVATPHFYINPPPLSSLSPLPSKKNCTPPGDSIFGRSYPPPPLIRGVGVPTMDNPLNILHISVASILRSL